MAKLEIQIHENTGATKDVAPYLGTFVSKGTINFAALANAVPQSAPSQARRTMTVAQ